MNFYLGFCAFFFVLFGGLMVENLLAANMARGLSERGDNMNKFKKAAFEIFGGVVCGLVLMAGPILDGIRHV